MVKNMKFSLCYLLAFMLLGAAVQADDTPPCTTPACCQTVCPTSQTIQSLITSASIINTEVHSVCCFCLVVGENPTQTGVKHLWYVNQCGVLEELASTPNTTNITVTSLRACGICFIKATITESIGGYTSHFVKVWRVEPQGSLTEIAWDNIALTNFNLSAVKECDLCFIKATATPVTGNAFSVLWLVDADLNLLNLVEQADAASAINVLGIKLCNICFIKATLTTQTPSTNIVLWRVENNGSLTRLVGPGTGVSASSLSLVGIKECNSCFVRAELTSPICGCSYILWRVEADGTLVEKRFLAQKDCADNCSTQVP